MGFDTGDQSATKLTVIGGRLTPLPAIEAGGCAGKEGCAKATEVVGDVPHAPIGAALFGGKPGRQNARTARPAEALHPNPCSTPAGALPCVSLPSAY